jgi:hypothetical protein
MQGPVCFIEHKKQPCILLLFFSHDIQWVAQGYHGKKKNNSRLYEKRMPTKAKLSIFEKPMMQDLPRTECFQE